MLNVQFTKVKVPHEQVENEMSRPFKDEAQFGAYLFATQCSFPLNMIIGYINTTKTPWQHTGCAHIEETCENISMPLICRWSDANTGRQFRRRSRFKKNTPQIKELLLFPLLDLLNSFWCTIPKNKPAVLLPMIPLKGKGALHSTLQLNVLHKSFKCSCWQLSHK